MSQFDWLCDVCGCLMSPTSGIYWVELCFINNYKKFQLWLVLLRYSVDMASAFPWVVTVGPSPSSNLAHGLYSVLGSYPSHTHTRTHAYIYIYIYWILQILSISYRDKKSKMMIILFRYCNEYGWIDKVFHSVTSRQGSQFWKVKGCNLHVT